MAKETTGMKLIKKLDLFNLEPEDQEAVLERCRTLIFQNAMAELVLAMDEDTKDRFDQLLEGNPSEDDMEAFLEAHVPEAPAILEHAVEEVVADMLAGLGK